MRSLDTKPYPHSNHNKTKQAKKDTSLEKKYNKLRLQMAPNPAN
jgi:hypothetical protein